MFEVRLPRVVRSSENFTLVQQYKNDDLTRQRRMHVGVDGLLRREEAPGEVGWVEGESMDEVGAHA